MYFLEHDILTLAIFTPMFTITLTIVVSLLLSGLFSGSEMAFVSANKLGIEVMRNKGHRRGAILARFYDDPKAFLGTMLVGNNIALVVFTIFMGQVIEPALIPICGDSTVTSLLVVTLVTTLVVLVFGEFLPKTIFRLYANELLFKLAYPLRIFKWILSVPTAFMTGLSNFLLKTIFKVPVENADNVLTRIDLEHFINDTISEEETIDKEILTNALNLSQVKVRDCMVPRLEIISIDQQSTLQEVIAEFKTSNLSRLLVTDGDIENVVGYIHHQQLISNPSNIKSLLLPISYVPEAMNVQELMLTFIKQGSNIACVVDEFGGTAGLITLEDILEEIFGEIEDEHDAEGPVEEVISDTEFIFSGRLEIDYLNEKYERLSIPEGEYHTLSGYLVMTAGNIPDAADEIILDGYKYIIETVGETRIESIRVIKLEETPEEEIPTV